jgi:phage terminase small subunit
MDKLKKVKYKDYADFIAKVGHGRLDGVSVTKDGYPLSVKEEKFISLFIVKGDIFQALRESGLTMSDIASKDYLIDEIRWRLEELRKETIADADEILQYFTRVMRGEVKDQFGLDAPLSERTAAAKELAKRVIDVEKDAEAVVPEIKITLNWSNSGTE